MVFVAAGDAGGFAAVAFLARAASPALPEADCAGFV
jgi:hypothetical protein